MKCGSWTNSIENRPNPHHEDHRDVVKDVYCAEVKGIPGLCAYGETVPEAVEQLEIVKKSAFELMLKQGKNIPLPTIHLEIPVDIYEQMTNKVEIAQFVVV